jgi:hypothetical protein
VVKKIDTMLGNIFFNPKSTFRIPKSKHDVIIKGLIDIWEYDFIRVRFKILSSLSAKKG